MEFTDLRFRVEAPLATITLDRPDARNAYSEAMVESLLKALDAAHQDEEVRVVLITGSGSAFSAGGDLKRMLEKSGMFAGGPTKLRQNYVAHIQKIPRAVQKVDKPIIAAINGPAMGAGLDLACMCDFRIAAASAKFGSTFVKVGLIPGDGGAYLLSRTIGLPRALDMILTGRFVDTDEAQQFGLVHRVVPDDQLLPAARDLAQMLAANAPIAVQLAKRAAYHAYDHDLESALELAATYQGIAQNTDDHLEAVSAMLQKRPSVFKGQ